MKKITSLIVLTIIILTCIFAFVACGDDPKNDPVLGWYANKNEKHFLHFYCEQDKLYVEEISFGVVSDTQLDGVGYKTTRSGEVTKAKTTYTLETQNYPYTYTLSKENNLQVIATNATPNLGSSNWRYVTSSEKSLEEMKNIFDTNNPWKK